MAEQPILHSDIIEIEKTIEGIQKIIRELQNMQAQMRKTAKDVITFQKKQDPSTSTSIPIASSSPQKFEGNGLAVDVSALHAPAPIL